MLKQLDTLDLLTYVMSVTKVAKILANRLKEILFAIISLNQNAYIPGRHIIGNILTTYEALHSLTHRCNDRHRYMAIKLDISKPAIN